MRAILLIAALLVLLEGMLILRLRNQNKTLCQKQAEVDKHRSDLSRALESVNAYETEVRSLKNQLGRLQEELEHTNPAPVSTALQLPQVQLPSGARTNLHPWGLTTNDVDLNAMFVTGSSEFGILWVPLVSNESLESVSESHSNRQTLVFGKVISKGYFSVWGRDGTNTGLGLHFKSKEDAEAMAEQMRVQGTE